MRYGDSYFLGHMNLSSIFSQLVEILSIETLKDIIC